MRPKSTRPVTPPVGGQPESRPEWFSKEGRTFLFARLSANRSGDFPRQDTLKINEDTVKYIVDKKGGDNSKVINLIKSIGKAAEEQSDDPYLIAMAERARVVQEAFEDRQTTTAETLAKLLREVEAETRPAKKSRLPKESTI